MPGEDLAWIPRSGCCAIHSTGGNHGDPVPFDMPADDLLAGQRARRRGNVRRARHLTNDDELLAIPEELLDAVKIVVGEISPSEIAAGVVKPVAVEKDEGSRHVPLTAFESE